MIIRTRIRPWHQWGHHNEKLLKKLAEAGMLYITIIVGHTENIDHFCVNRIMPPVRKRRWRSWGSFSNSFIVVNPSVPLFFHLYFHCFCTTPLGFDRLLGVGNIYFSLVIKGKKVSHNTTQASSCGFITQPNLCNILDATCSRLSKVLRLDKMAFRQNM